MTTQRAKKRRKMVRRRRRSMMGKSPSQSWSHGVAGAWSETFVSSRGKTAVKRRRTMRRKKTMKGMTCVRRIVTQMALCSTKMKTQMKMRKMSPHLVRIYCI